MTHGVAIHQINFPRLAPANDKMRVRHAAGSVQQQDRTTGAEISVGIGKGKLIVGRELIGNLQAVGGGKLDETVTIVAAIGIRAETAVASLKEEVGVRIHAQSVASHP